MSRLSARLVVPIASLSLVSLVLLAPRLAWSQSQGGAIDMQLFRPAIDTKGLITLDSHEPLAHLALSLRTNLAYAYRPFALSGTPKGGTWCSDGTTNCLPADPTYVLSRYRIDHLVTGYLGGAIGLFKRFEVGFGFPIGFWLGSSEPSPQQGVDKLDIGRDSALGLGDITLHLKAKIFGERRLGMGIGTRLTVAFPTGRDDAFLGSGRFRVTPVILADRHFWKRRIHLAFNLGGHLRFGGETQPWVDTRLCQVPGSVGNADCGTGRVLETTHHLFYGAGMALTVVRKRLELLAEFIGQTGFNGFYDLDPEGALVSAHEVLVGLRVRLLGRTFFEAGAGMGLNRGDANIQYGSPRFRAYFGLSIEATLRYAKEQAKKLGNLAPVKAMIEKYREKARAKLAEYVAQAKKKVEDKAKDVALAAISKALESSLAGDAQALVDEVLGAFERWQAIKKQLVEYSAARGAQLRAAKAKLQRLLKAGQITTAEVEKALRAWVKKRVTVVVLARAEKVLADKVEALLRPIFESASNAVSSIAGSVPGIGGALTVSANLLIAKARNRVQTEVMTRTLSALEKLLDRTLEKLYAAVFRQGGRLDSGLSWLNKKSGLLSKLIEETTNRIEGQRKALLAKLGAR